MLMFLLPQATPTNAAQRQTNAALVALRASNPKVQWDAKSAVMADITCDGINDVVVVGYDAESVWFALVPGLKGGKLGKPMVNQLLIDPGVQGGLCSKPVHIEIYPLDCEGDSGPLPGCKMVKGASGFQLADDHCDPFNFYWDSERKTLRWWRN
jgi:hypothetical protein